MRVSGAGLQVSDVRITARRGEAEGVKGSAIHPLPLGDEGGPPPALPSAGAGRVRGLEVLSAHEARVPHHIATYPFTNFKAAELRQ